MPSCFHTNGALQISFKPPVSCRLYTGAFFFLFTNLNSSFHREEILGHATPSADGLSAVRAPRQDRSRASFERMMSAAEALLVEHGSDEFALTDISRVGKVSIGSIYNRFVSKDELIRAVHARVMERLEAEQARLIMRARSRGRSPAALVRAVVEELGEFLAAHASVMRPLMLRAAFDSQVQNRGRQVHNKLMSLLCAELLARNDAIVHPDPERAVRGVISITYAAFARELGYGMTEAPKGGLEWEELKTDLGDMATHFLFSVLPTTDGAEAGSREC